MVMGDLKCTWCGNELAYEVDWQVYQCRGCERIYAPTEVE